jgi:hypothetical protein
MDCRVNQTGPISTPVLAKPLRDDRAAQVTQDFSLIPYLLIVPLTVVLSSGIPTLLDSSKARLRISCNRQST